MAPETGARGSARRSLRHLFRRRHPVGVAHRPTTLLRRRAGPGGRGAGPGRLVGTGAAPADRAPSKRAIRVPARADAITMKALAAKPEERYQTGEELRTDLAAFLARNAPAMDGHQVAHFSASCSGTSSRGSARNVRRSWPAPRRCSMRPATAKPTRLRRWRLRRRHGGDRGDTAPLGRRGKARSAPRSQPLVRGGSRMVGRPSGRALSHQAPARRGGMGRVYEAEHIEIGQACGGQGSCTRLLAHPRSGRALPARARAASRNRSTQRGQRDRLRTTPEGSLSFVMEYIEGIELGLPIHREGR